MMKILISDIDGTLIKEDQNISQSNVEYMRELQRQGHKIALCTGRNSFEMQWVLDTVAFPYDYLILNNGAFIVDKNQQIIYEKMIDGDVGKAVLDYVSRFEELDYFYSDGKSSYGYENGYYVERMTKQFQHVDDLFYQESSCFEIISFCQRNHQMDISQQCFEYIQNHWHQQLSLYYNLHYVDIVAKGCSKGNAVMWLCDYLKIDDSSIYAIGDSYNDLSMLEKVKNSYTFDYAHDDIKTVIPRHVHYVYEVIQKMLEEEKV